MSSAALLRPEQSLTKQIDKQSISSRFEKGIALLPFSGRCETAQL
jgi:hypothetical protein